MSVSQLALDVANLDDGYRATLRALYEVPDAPAVLVYNASLLAPDGILTSTVEHLREAYDVDVIAAVVAAQIAAPVMRAAGSGDDPLHGWRLRRPPGPCACDHLDRKGGAAGGGDARRSRGRRRRRSRREHHDRRTGCSRDGLRREQHRRALLDRSYRRPRWMAGRVPLSNRMPRSRWADQPARRRRWPFTSTRFRSY